MILDSGAVITIVMFMIVHLAGFIWWASRMQATLEFIKKQVDDLVANQTTYVHQSEHIKDIARIDKDLDAVWKRLNDPHACPNGCKK
jgi:hypothetical protein